MFIYKKNLFDINRIYISSLLLKNSFDYINKFVIFNIRTIKLDEILFIYNRFFLKSFPSSLNYFINNLGKYPNSICTSLNDIVFHGLPNKNIILNINDSLNIDISLNKDGYYSDMSRMYLIYIIKCNIKKFINISYFVLWKIFNFLLFHKCLNKISIIILKYININNYNLVYECCGHGIGFYFHEDPTLFCFKNNFKFKIKNNIVFTIEPIINLGKRYIIKNNLWENKTFDNKISSQWEHSFLLLKNNIKILTK